MQILFCESATCEHTLNLSIQERGIFNFAWLLILLTFRLDSDFFFCFSLMQEVFYLTYTPEDVDGNIQLETGDKINFIIETNKQ